MDGGDDVLRLANRTARVWTWVGLSAAAAFTVIRIESLLDEGLPWYLWPLDLLLGDVGGMVALVLVPRLARVPLFQPWLELSPAGLDYGGRQHVPWEQVGAVRRGKLARWGRSSVVFGVHDWSPRGPMAWMIRSTDLPLDVVDPEWRSNGVVEAIARWAPHVQIAG